MTEIQEKEKPKIDYQKIYIYKKYITKVKNQRGEYFYKLTFYSSTEMRTKHVYISYNSIRPDKYQKGYIGRLKRNHLLSGTEEVPTKINTEEFLKYFPINKMPKRDNKPKKRE